MNIKTRKRHHGEFGGFGEFENENFEFLKKKFNFYNDF